MTASTCVWRIADSGEISNSPHTRPEAIAKVPPEMVIQANLLGDTEMVRNRIRTFRDAGVTTLRVAPQGRDLAEKLATLGRVMDLVRG